MDTLIETNEPEEILVPETGIEPDLGGFEVVEETTAGPTAEELAAQLEALRKEKELLEQSANLTTGMQEGFQTLAQQLQAQQGNKFDNLPGLPPAPNNMPQQNFALPDKETFEKEFFTNPYDSFQKMLAPVIGSQQATINNQMAEMNKMISKNNAYMNESNKEILNKYGDEVQVYASRLNSNDPWGDAIKQVTTNHFNDIMQEKIKATETSAYEKAMADLKAAQDKVDQVSSGSPVGSTNLGMATNPGSKKVRITKAEMQKVKDMTAMKFGPNSGAETELQMYNYMKENNLL